MSKCNKQTVMMETYKDGSISCPPKCMGGCGGKGILKLNQVLPDGWLSNKISKAEDLYELYNLDGMSEDPIHWCSCYNLARDNTATKKIRKAAPRENSDDNYLYSPSSIDIQAGDRNSEAFSDPLVKRGTSDCYTEGIHLSAWPQMLKLNDWPQSGSLDDHLPRHNAEVLSALPFKEYTHPRSAYLNLAVKLPEGNLKPDTGPKLYTLR
ncbi:hypothetical protein ACET3Z_017714 [Daucus carota]